MFPWLSNILSRLLIDRKDGHRREVLASFAEKQRVAGLSSAEQERYRNQKLAELLNHARETVPFWRDKISGDVTADNAREVLKGLPVMERAAIQEERARFEAGEGVRCSVFGVRGRGEDNVQHSTFPPEADQHTAGNIQHSSGVPSSSSSQSKIQNPQSKIGRVVVDATGGSSGTPMRFLVDRATQIARESSLYWANSLAGWAYGERIAMLWGSDRDVGNAKKDPKLELRWKIDNIRWYNAFNMGEEQMAEFHKEMSRFRPHVIVAYAGSLELYARYLREKGLKGERVKGEAEENFQHSTFPPEADPPVAGNIQHSSEESGENDQDKSRTPNPDSSAVMSAIGLAKAEHRHLSPQSTNPPNYPINALVSSAEVLTPQARSLIESVFGKPIFNRYGNREFGALAAEDGEGGLLVNPVDCMVEIDSVDPVRVPGAILVTYLHNFAMPFVRYNTGDLAVWVEGEEGRRIARIQGRQGDTIRTKGGRLIHGEYFTHLMYDAPGVKEFQFVQERIDFFRLRVVSEQRDAELEAVWKQKIEEALGEPATIEVEYVESIPLLKSGKRKFTISMV